MLYDTHTHAHEERTKLASLVQIIGYLHNKQQYSSANEPTSPHVGATRTKQPPPQPLWCSTYIVRQFYDINTIIRRIILTVDLLQGMISYHMQTVYLCV